MHTQQKKWDCRQIFSKWTTLINGLLFSEKIDSPLILLLLRKMIRRHMIFLFVRQNRAVSLLLEGGKTFRQWTPLMSGMSILLNIDRTFIFFLFVIKIQLYVFKLDDIWSIYLFVKLDVIWSSHLFVKLGAIWCSYLFVKLNVIWSSYLFVKLDVIWSIYFFVKLDVIWSSYLFVKLDVFWSSYLFVKLDVIWSSYLFVKLDVILSGYLFVKLDVTWSGYLFVKLELWRRDSDLLLLMENSNFSAIRIGMTCIFHKKCNFCIIFA